MRSHDRAGRPRVIANLAMSADGKIDSAAREGGGFSSRLDRDRMDQLRSEVDALVVGATTVRAEDPPLFIRDPARRSHRLQAGHRPELVVTVVSGSGSLPPGARFLREPAAARILAVPEDLPDEALAPLATVIGDGTLAVRRLGHGRVDVRALVGALHEAGCRTILVEGGGELVASFVEADLLDELHVTLCPTLIGGRTAPTLFGGEGFRIAGRVALQLQSVEQRGSELFLHYVVDHR